MLHARAGWARVLCLQTASPAQVFRCKILGQGAGLGGKLVPATRGSLTVIDSGSTQTCLFARTLPPKAPPQMQTHAWAPEPKYPQAHTDRNPGIVGLGERSLLPQGLPGAGVWGIVGRKMKPPRRGVEPRDLRAPGAKAEPRGQSGAAAAWVGAAWRPEG